MTPRKTSSGAEAIAPLAQTAMRQGVKRETLSSLIEAASEEGATRALFRLGLHDKNAGHDIRALRDLLYAWRDTRRTARRTVVKWITAAFILFILATLAIKLKLPFLTP